MGPALIIRDDTCTQDKCLKAHSVNVHVSDCFWTWTMVSIVLRRLHRWSMYLLHKSWMRRRWWIGYPCFRSLFPYVKLFTFSIFFVSIACAYHCNVYFLLHEFSQNWSDYSCLSWTVTWDYVKTIGSEVSVNFAFRAENDPLLRRVEETKPKGKNRIFWKIAQQSLKSADLFSRAKSAVTFHIK